MKRKKMWWATGIFKNSNGSVCGSVYTLSLGLKKLTSGFIIDAKLLKLAYRTNSNAELVKTLLTYDYYSPMSWWSDYPAKIVTHKNKKYLWGDGEGALKRV